MPYIAIKAYQKDEQTKKELVQKFMEVIPEIWGCSREAITISIEEYTPEEYKEKVLPEITPKMDKVWVLNGENKEK